MALILTWNPLAQWVQNMRVAVTDFHFVCCGFILDHLMLRCSYEAGSFVRAEHQSERSRARALVRFSGTGAPTP